MSRIESKLKEFGFTLPPLMQEPDGVPLPFRWINVRGDRAFVSGHGRKSCSTHSESGEVARVHPSRDRAALSR